MANHSSSPALTDQFHVTDVNDATANFFTDATSTDDYFSDYSFVTGMILAEPCTGSEPQELAVKVVQLTLFFIAFFFGVIGNGLVIGTFARYRCLRLRCMTDVFLFYLALSDLLLLLTLPLQADEVVHDGWVLGDSLCKLNNSMIAINTNAGLLLLACISVDRYLVVVWARAAQRLRPGMLRYSKLSALIVAVISILFSLPELLFSAVVSGYNEGLGSCWMDIWVKEIDWVKKCARVVKITGFCIPCVAMLVCYSAIGHVLLQGGGKSWRRQRTLRLMGALVLLFLLFQLPHTIVMSYGLFSQLKDCVPWERFHLSEVITRSMAYIRCCLNPVLYALVGVRFRNDVMRLLRDWGCMCTCLKHLTPLESRESSVTPSSPPATTTLSPLPSANGPLKILFNNGTPLQTQANTKHSCATNTFVFSTQEYHKDPTYVSWGEH